ncbi:hypothetical protein NO2_0571 [Candidatus Termititenax persephonae]|uniref:Uncharacterized protein n=1 Tax=Candidatus Termititenax persephonae TaxID=2218525 RepID=A0A388TH07_9BACT|nr:hypothetical protein NO2_0571 [Candidatus Termititenax persephonae]
MQISSKHIANQPELFLPRVGGRPKPNPKPSRLLAGIGAGILATSCDLLVGGPTGEKNEYPKPTDEDANPPATEPLVPPNPLDPPSDFIPGDEVPETIPKTPPPDWQGAAIVFAGGVIYHNNSTIYVRIDHSEAPRLTDGLSGEAAEADYQSEKRRLSGLRLDLAEYRRQYQELHGELPREIILQFEQYPAMNNFSLAILKRFKISLYDSTSAELADTLANKSLRNAHTIDVSLDPSQNALPTLAEYGITFDEAAMTVKIDLTQRTISWDNIMRDEGAGTVASYIQRYESTAEGGVKFNMQARPASTKDWAFIGVYYNDKFDLPLDSGKTFSYKLSNFVAPDYGHDEKDAGYRVVFSFGKKADGVVHQPLFVN